MCGSKGDSEDKDYDPTKNGPIKNRSCTDVICCLLFIICVLGMAVCGYFGYSNGDPTRLLYPTDSDGNLCGFGNKLSTPNLFFFDLVECAKQGAAIAVNGCPTPQVCVKECPKTNWVFLTGATIETVSGTAAAASERAKMLCKDGVETKTSTKVDKPCSIGIN